MVRLPRFDRQRLTVVVIFVSAAGGLTGCGAILGIDDGARVGDDGAYVGDASTGPDGATQSQEDGSAGQNDGTVSATDGPTGGDDRTGDDRTGDEVIAVPDSGQGGIDADLCSSSDACATACIAKGATCALLGTACCHPFTCQADTPGPGSSCQHP